MAKKNKNDKIMKNLFEHFFISLVEPIEFLDYIFCFCLLWLFPNAMIITVNGTQPDSVNLHS